MMGLSVNQILVICLILVLVGFVAVLGNMGVHAIKLLKELKKFLGVAENCVEESKSMVKNASDKVIESATSLAQDADTTTKAVSVAAAGIVGFSLVSGLLRRVFGGKSRAKRAIKRSNKELKEAEKAAKKARKIQKRAAKLGRLR